MARKRRERGFKLRYAVLGEGITEQWYLTHLKKYKNYRFSIKPSLFADISLEKAERFIDELLDGGCDHITFLTDYDTVLSQGKHGKFNELVNRYKDIEEVLICDSMPSIEIWFLLHFVFTTQEFPTFETLKKVLERELPGYEKSRKYLEKEGWFETLIGNGGFEKARGHSNRLLRQLAEGNVGQHFPFTKMPLAIDAFEKQRSDKFGED
jgi:hypothetical protein